MFLRKEYGEAGGLPWLNIKYGFNWGHLLAPLNSSKKTSVADLTGDPWHLAPVFYIDFIWFVA
jgi:hypothetical protein